VPKKSRLKPPPSQTRIPSKRSRHRSDVRGPSAAARRARPRCRTGRVIVIAAWHTLLGGRNYVARKRPGSLSRYDRKLTQGSVLKARTRHDWPEGKLHDTSCFKRVRWIHHSDRLLVRGVRGPVPYVTSANGHGTKPVVCSNSVRRVITGCVVRWPRSADLQRRQVGVFSWYAARASGSSPSGLVPNYRVLK
jgi:hypothetical protein